jgi:epoxide hydrolase-like predicted phosphatase
MRDDVDMGDFDAVLFDFGGVFTASPFALLWEAASGFGVPPEVVLRTCFGSYAEDTDHPWHRLERGEVTVTDALAAIGDLGAADGVRIDPVEVLKGSIGTGDVIRADVVAAVREVRGAGLATGLVTNNIREFGTKWRALLPLGELFDVVVDSCEEGMRKPDPRIYHLALERLGGMSPERVVFLDDAPGNVDAARAVGLAAILVETDYQAALATLRDMLALS